MKFEDLFNGYVDAFRRMDGARDEDSVVFEAYKEKFIRTEIALLHYLGNSSKSEYSVGGEKTPHPWVRIKTSGGHVIVSLTEGVEFHHFWGAFFEGSNGTRPLRVFRLEDLKDFGDWFQDHLPFHLMED